MDPKRPKTNRNRAQKALQMPLARKRMFGDEYRQFCQEIFLRWCTPAAWAQAVCFLPQSQKIRVSIWMNLAFRDGTFRAARELAKKFSRTVDLVEYQQTTREAIECATWIKRYAESKLKEIASQPPTAILIPREGNKKCRSHAEMLSARSGRMGGTPIGTNAGLFDGSISRIVCQR